jgi:hypothetical protein
MKTEEARRLIALADDDEPAVVPASVLSALTIDDMPDGGALQVGTTKERVIHLDWEGGSTARKTQYSLKPITPGHVNTGIHHWG